MLTTGAGMPKRLHHQARALSKPRTINTIPKFVIYHIWLPVMNVFRPVMVFFRDFMLSYQKKLCKGFKVARIVQGTSMLVTRITGFFFCQKPYFKNWSLFISQYCIVVLRFIATVLTLVYTHSIQQSPSWEANRFAASQEIPRILWNPNVHYRIHLSLSWASKNQSILLHATSWRSTLILSSHLRLDIPSGHFPSGFPTKTLYIPHPNPTRATCPLNQIILDIITRTILGEQYAPKYQSRSEALSVNISQQDTLSWWAVVSSSCLMTLVCT
jgi:hypothetical protein